MNTHNDKRDGQKQKRCPNPKCKGDRFRTVQKVNGVRLKVACRQCGEVVACS